MSLKRALIQIFDQGPVLQNIAARGNLKVVASFLGPAYRGLIKQQARASGLTRVESDADAHFDWTYLRDHPAMAKLYEAAKGAQWNAERDLDWSIPVDPQDPERPLMPEAFHPIATHPLWQKLTEKERASQRHALLSWLLSQFLHGEQGALFAAAQVTQSVPWLDAKLYGSSQVVDEGRHVEVFHAYLTRKLEWLYTINDNLYVVIDALMTDGRWDVKFLGMQIMIEGLALGAFSTIRQLTSEPLLKQMLGYVIADEARHVHYGVLALEEHFRHLPERARREREEWAYEVAVLLRDRFLAHEFYEEHYGHAMTRAQWDELLVSSQLMGFFRQSLFKRIVPNLRRIGLLSDRIRPHYEAMGVMGYVDGRAAPELTAEDLLLDRT